MQDERLIGCDSCLGPPINSLIFVGCQLCKMLLGSSQLWNIRGEIKSPLEPVKSFDILLMLKSFSKCTHFAKGITHSYPLLPSFKATISYWMLDVFMAPLKKKEKGNGTLLVSLTVGIKAFSWEGELVLPTQALLYSARGKVCFPTHAFQKTEILEMLSEGIRLLTSK